MPFGAVYLTFFYSFTGSICSPFQSRLTAPESGPLLLKAKSKNSLEDVNHYILGNTLFHSAVPQGSNIELLSLF